MANKLLTRIVLRNDSTLNWLASDNSATDKLLKGEIGLEFVTDSTTGAYTGKVRMKIGDGEHTWSELPYFGGDECHIFEASVEAQGNHSTAIAQAVGTNTLNRGDIAIVKEAVVALEEGQTVNAAGKIVDSSNKEICAQRYQYTAYVYGETADGSSDWKAMDGNYNADNVYFSDDMLITQKVGYCNITNGQGKIPSKGKNLTQVFEAMYVQEAYPNATNPSVSFTHSTASEYSRTGGTKGYTATKGSFEVGTYVTPKWSASFNPGSYTYGPATGITVSSWEISDTNTNTDTAASGTFPEFQIGDNTSYYITAKANHTAGTVPVTNKGNAYAAKQITAGSKSNNTSSDKITGYRKMFIGAFSEPIELTGANIRLNCTGQVHPSNSTFDINVPAGTNQVVIALLKDYSLYSVANSIQFGTDIYSGSNFPVKFASLPIAGANNFTAAEYVVYEYAPKASVGADTVFTCKYE